MDIEFEDKALKRQLINDEPIHEGRIRVVRSSSTNFIGGEGQSGILECITTYLAGINQSILQSLNGSRGWAGGLDGPYWQVCDPYNGESICYSIVYDKNHIHDTNLREPYEPSAHIEVFAICNEIIEVTHDYLETARDWGVDIASTPSLRGLEKDLEKVEERLESL